MLNSLKKQFPFLILVPVLLASPVLPVSTTARQALIDEMVKSGTAAQVSHMPPAVRDLPAARTVSQDANRA